MDAKRRATYQRGNNDMANIKQDLDEYLLLQSDQKKSFNVSLPQVKMPTMSGFSSYFSAPTAPIEEVHTWYGDIKEALTLKLTRMQRIFFFIGCLAMGIFCMGSSALYIPVLILKTRQFAALYTLGSVFFILSFCFLSGFGAFFGQMFSRPRLLTSVSYTVTLVLTLYSSVVAKSTILTIIFAVGQMSALFFMVVGAVPGGTTGLRFFSQLFTQSVSSATKLPV